MRILYFDCFSGISGDMALAALVDAGADRDYIEQELKKIDVEPFTLHWKRVNKNGISALKMDVMVEPEHASHHHRHYSDIVKYIESSGLSPRVKALSLAIFAKIGAAEAKIHNIPIEKVHFHEVGAIDSIVDVIGVALAIDSLQVEKLVSAPVPLGSGSVKCDHGLYPVPAPATLEMMRGLPIAPSSQTVELTTPTGAGIVSGIVTEFSQGIPKMIVHSVGYGAGTRDLPNVPNVLRCVVGETEQSLTVPLPYVEAIPTHEHGHSHEHSHTHEHPHGHGHDHDHDHGHTHDHTHGHSDDHDHKRHEVEHKQKSEHKHKHHDHH